ncbi:hypothetical protein [Gluconobacter albidus]|uniref:hypothetical protein n=1 Tax=Gluconobacter albidus TaxID=318683 RepID=UPI001B8D4D11|nr:hypothetical protein [Gluconobacter albidus]MBS1028764.1 hypothetical protein [Gluconobacter albidus]
MSELPTTKEGLIWEVAVAIAKTEGRASPSGTFYESDGGREYIAQLMIDASAIVNGPPKKSPTQVIGEAQKRGPGNWMGN